MEDMKLLEAAAKAAGYTYEISAYVEIYDPDGIPKYWNPFDNDADALRLATTLHMMINVEYGETEVAAHPSVSDGHSIVELHNGDALAATRRAIVRCAAGDYA